MDSRPVQLDDVFRYCLVGDTQISPDGERVVFTVRRTDREKNRYLSALWMTDVAAGTSREFTGGDHSDGNPRWSPDGSQIAFVSDRDKPGSQIYLISPTGGEARKLSTLDEGGVGEIVWSPDGSRIAFRYRVIPLEYREKARKEREEKSQSSPVRVHSRMFYRLDGFGYFDESYWQIWVIDVQTGEARALTDEPCHHGSISWSPDGSRIAFVANRDSDADLKVLYDKLWIVPAAGGDIKPVAAPDGPKGGTAWSPDGRWIAYVGHTDVTDSWGCRNERLLVVPATGSGDVRDLTGSSDLAVGYLTLSDMQDAGGGDAIVWSSDSQVLYFPVSNQGDTRLYHVGINAGGLAPLTPALLELGSFSLSADESVMAVQLSTATNPHEVFVGSLESTGDLRQVSDVNAAVNVEVALQMPEPFSADAKDGAHVCGWILRPTGFDVLNRYPCVVYVHGGPALQYGGQSTPFHELQWLAAQGYVVAFCNPRGSKGYGEAHTSAIQGDWGNKDWLDVETATDFAAGLPYVDVQRMAIMGGSYGGYMTAWAIGHTNRFRCAIADRLVANNHSMSGTSDFPWEHGTFYKGNAWDDPTDLWRTSPLKFAGKIETPLLLIHSDGDLRCPTSQSEELFAALRWQRKTVELVRYPAETSHGMSRNGPPDLRKDRLERNLAWLDRWLKD